MERYEVQKDIGSGNFGVAKLVRDTWTGELFAVKCIERGNKIDEHVQREIMNHRSLKHPSIIRFKEVMLTYTHLAIVMEYAAGGELFEKICNAGRFAEEEIWFPLPGKDPCIFFITMKLGDNLVWKPVDYVRVSSECKHLPSRIFVADPEKRITIPEIKKHPWFLKNSPEEFTQGKEEELSAQSNDKNYQSQSIEDILGIVQEARKEGEGIKSNVGEFVGGGRMDFNEVDTDEDIIDDDIDTSGGFICAL